MSTIALSAPTRPLSGASHVEEGPVLLAAKPFDSSDAPLAVARWLAQREERELHVVSVLERGDALALSAGVPPLPERYYDDERAAISERMIEELHSHTDQRVRVQVLDGPSAEAIVDAAHDRGARVIVIGTGRHDSLGRFVYGERAMQIVRIADRPVLVVPRGASGGFVRHAAVAVDFSPASLRAAAAVLPMLSRGSMLTLVHVKPADAVQQPCPTNTSVINGQCAERFNRFLALLAIPPGVTVERRVLWGNPVTAIDAFARLHGVSLIASGRRQSHTIAERLFVGSVSVGLLRRVECPLLIVPEENDVASSGLVTALTGVESWPRDEWPKQLEAFNLRNRTARVRLATELEGLQGGRCVAQDYQLQEMTYDTKDERLCITLTDTAPTPNALLLRMSDVTELTLFSDVEGNDMRLAFETASGRGTVTVR